MTDSDSVMSPLDRPVANLPLASSKREPIAARAEAIELNSQVLHAVVSVVSRWLPNISWAAWSEKPFRWYAAVW